jgi:asparagine N-glycosylation enzyme membrane subunit Stt3
MKENLLIWLDRFLVADVFLVIIGFLWFAIALIGRSLGIPLGWDIWYKLWQPVFNPAIGILFTGALLSWVIKKIGQKFNK